MVETPPPPAPLPTPQTILEQRHLLQHQRSERMLIELIRGAFLINGGALIAVMPVVTAMIGQAAPARLDLTTMVGAFIVGLLLAAMAALFAYVHADEEVDVSEYRLRRAALPKPGRGPLGLPLKFSVPLILAGSLAAASVGFINGADELEKLSKPAPCPASEPWCNVPEIELANDVLNAMVQAKLAEAAESEKSPTAPTAPPPTASSPAKD